MHEETGGIYNVRLVHSLSTVASFFPSAGGRILHQSATSAEPTPTSSQFHSSPGQPKS